MAEERDPPRPLRPKGGEDPNRRLTPQSARRIVTKGASEMVVDDFVDAYLRERPKTIVPEVTSSKSPTSYSVHTRPTVRNMPAVQGERDAPVSEPPVSQPPVSSQALTADEEEILRALADKDERVSELEGELNRMRSELEQAKRESHSNLGDAKTPPSVPAPRRQTAPVSVEPTPVGPTAPSPAASGPAKTSVHSLDGEAVPVDPVGRAPSARKGRTYAWALAGVVTVVAGGAIFAAQQGMLGSGAAPGARTFTSTSIAATAASPSPSASLLTPAPPPRASAAVSTQAPVPSVTSAPANSSAAVSASEDDSPEDMKKLLSFQAYLTVSSTVDATVVVQGQDVGRTNERLMVRCGPRNVRLRGANGDWLSPGNPVQISCMRHTRVNVAPTQ